MTLQSVATGNLAQPLTFTFQPTTGGRSYAQTVTPDAADGSFTVSGVPVGTYNLFVKGSKWLQKLVSVDTTGGSVTGLNVSLLGGDCNGDNLVSLGDYFILLNAFAANPSSPNWNAGADLNCDGIVSLGDYFILLNNFGKIGDAPTAPTLTGVTSGVGNGCSVLAWTPSATASGYNVYRSTANGSGYTQVSANQTNPYYVDLSVTNGTPYYYLVTSLSGGTEGFDSTQLTVTPNSTGGTLVAVTTPGTVTPSTTTTTMGGTTYTTILSNSGSNFTVHVSFNSAGSPDAPTHLSATGRNSEVVLQWDASPGAVSYNIYRNGSRIASNYTGPSLGNDVSNNNVPYFVYTDTQVNNLTLYTYWVTAVNLTKEGAATPEMDGEPSGSFGWVQRHRTYTTGVVYGSSDYDWTGLSKTNFRRNGQSTLLPNPLYFGVDRFTDDFLPTGGVIGESLGGTSTYTWEWVPPVNSKGLHNDPQKAATDSSQPFPVPPLFVLGRTIANVYADPDQDANFSASGSVKDGLTAANPTLQPTLSVSSGQPPAGSPTLDFVPSHGFLTTATKLAQPQQPLGPILADATLSPYLQITVNNADYGYGEAYMAETAYPLLLANPDPMVRPDLGDANGIENQFVYSADSPSLLQVPAYISTGGDPITDDTNWLINAGHYPRATWKFDAVPAGSPVTTTQYPLLYGGTSPAYLGDVTLSSGSYLVPTTQDVHNTHVLQFYGLPDSVYGLGNHTVTLGVQNNPSGSSYSNSQTAYIQTFFPAGQFNHPNQDTTPTPNWLYYYNQIFPATGTSDAANPRYNISYVAGTGPSNASPNPVGDSNPLNHLIQIKDDAYIPASAPLGFRVFDVSPTPDPDLNTRLVRFIGILHMSSFLYYAGAARHEQGHVDTYVTPDGSGYGNIYTINKGPYDPSNNPNTTTDNDNISDGWELAHHMDPRVSDTTNGKAGYGSPGGGIADAGNIADNQILADLPAVGAIFNEISQWNSDWSDSGAQYHNSALPFISDPYPNDSSHLPIYPDATLIGTSPKYPATFYLIFDAAVNGKTFQAMHQYKIKSIDDLKKEYPDLLSSLSDLDKP